MASGRLIDYLGVGVIADRPATPDLHPDTLGLWYATDTDTLSAWDGSAWEDIAGGGGSGTVTSVGLSYGSSVSDVLSVAGSPITTSGTLTVSAVDPAADRLLFWDDSAGKLTYLTLGTGLAISGTTINGTPSRTTVSALGTSGSVTIDYALGDYFTLGLTGNVTSLGFSNLPGAGNGATLMIRITQDSTPRTITWPASFKWAGGSAGAISTTSGAVDVLAITTFDNGTTWIATLNNAFAV